jgi:hypothetical protein
MLDWSRPRQCHREPGAVWHGVYRPYLAAMGLGYPAPDGQPKTAAGDAALATAAIEPVEQMGQVLGVDAGTGVLDFQDRAAPVLATKPIRLRRCARRLLFALERRASTSGRRPHALLLHGLCAESDASCSSSSTRE